MFADVGVFPRKGKMFDRFYLSIKNRVFPKTKSLIQVWLYAVKEVQISLKKLIFQFKDLNWAAVGERATTWNLIIRTSGLDAFADVS